MNGKKVSLIKVFELSLKYIKEEAIKWLRKNFDNPGRKIQWIITVPAIWSPAAKQTMRRAASGVRQHSILVYVTGFAKTVPNGTRIEIQFIA